MSEPHESQLQYLDSLSETSDMDGGSASSVSSDESEDLDPYEDDGNIDDEAMERKQHWQLWDAMLAWADSETSAGGYDIEPTRGEGQGDRTTFLRAQRSWGFEFNRRPSMLKQWEGPRATPPYRLGILKFAGHVVVDFEGQPICDFQNLPICICSNVEGWRVEAWMRQDSRLRYPDIIARMRTKNTPGGHEPIYNSKTVAKRAQLFRKSAALITWTDRKAETLKKFVDGIRRVEMTATQLARNLALPRDLTAGEFAQLTKATKKDASSKAINAADEKASVSAGDNDDRRREHRALSTTVSSGNRPENSSSSSQQSPDMATTSATEVAANQGANVGNSEGHHTFPATATALSTRPATNVVRSPQIQAEDSFISYDDFAASFSIPSIARFQNI